MRRAVLVVFVSCVAFLQIAHADAPNVRLPDLDGKAHNVREYIGNGRWVIVTVWSADCPICQREMYHMTFFQEEHKDRDAQVLGLSVDGMAQRDKAREFASEQSLNFPNLIGQPGDAARLSGQPLAGTPTYYFFAPNGKFVTLRVGALTQAQAESVLDTIKRAR
jgi:peroxiredoxin